MNIARLICAELRKCPDREILVDESISLTGSKALNLVYLRTQLLKDCKVAPGEGVIVTSNRGVLFWIDVLALWVVGAKPVCIEGEPAVDHLEDVLSKTGASRIFCGEELLPGFNGLSPLVCDDSQPCEVTSIDQLPWYEPSADGSDVAAVLFTSGTTGLPKACPLTHAMLIYNTLATRGALGLTSRDRLMIATPFRFISSVSHFLVTIVSGACFVGYESKLFGRTFIEALVQQRITAFGGSPFHCRFIASADQNLLPDLRWVMSSGDHLPIPIIEDLEARYDNLAVLVVYGMVELGGRFCVMPPEQLTSKKGSVGFPLPGYEVRILDENNQPCKPGEVGRVHTYGIYNFKGYVDNARLNSEVVSELGYMCGDMGYLDEDGYLFISGRSDSVFKRSGLKVSAQVLIDSLLGMDGVQDAFASGQEDPVEGHVPYAYVVRSDESIENSDITRYLRETVPVNHLPKRMFFLNEIPRTGSGKVDRRKIKEVTSGG